MDIFGSGKLKGFLVSKSSGLYIRMLLGLLLCSSAMLAVSRMTGMEHKGLRLYLEQTFKHAIMYTSNEVIGVVIIFPGHSYIWSATYHPWYLVEVFWSTKVFWFNRAFQKGSLYSEIGTTRLTEGLWKLHTSTSSMCLLQRTAPLYCWRPCFLQNTQGEKLACCKTSDSVKLNF